MVTLNVRGEPQPCTAKVSKVGRRWISVDGKGYSSMRFDAETGRIDGGAYSSPGKVYASEAEYHETTQKQKACREFRGRLPFTAPTHFTLADVEKISAEIWPAGYLTTGPLHLWRVGICKKIIYLSYKMFVYIYK